MYGVSDCEVRSHLDGSPDSLLHVRGSHRSCGADRLVRHAVLFGKFSQGVMRPLLDLFKQVWGELTMAWLLI